MTGKSSAVEGVEVTLVSYRILHFAGHSHFVGIFVAFESDRCKNYDFAIFGSVETT